MKKKGILLVNLGTPNSTKTSDVRKYLREFLMDKRVVDVPFPIRWILVNGVIAPFRAPKSAKEYRKLFDDRGSPLKYYTEDITYLLREKLSEEYVVKFAMRYQHPSLESVLKEFKEQRVAALHVIPLFPQYASATTGSVIDKVMEFAKEWQVIPNIKFTAQFLEEELFIETIVDQGKALTDKDQYDHYVFSYHGLPERQIRKASYGKYCQLGKCCGTLNEHNRYCYRAQCFETTRLVAAGLNIPEEQYTVCFQSRLGKDPWVKPYTEDVLKELAEKGIKKVLAFSPAFVSDCLETTIEVGEMYQEEFIHAGGEKWDLVPSLNKEDKWVECLKQMVVN
ncbi:MAG: ferrochelatase [Ekhidna sp.]|nr:ferrochelatase [Ekhidna sp.]MBC6426219.1 ferrochelatase [Ekhidna sp.]